MHILPDTIWVDPSCIPASIFDNKASQVTAGPVYPWKNFWATTDRQVAA